MEKPKFFTRSTDPTNSAPQKGNFLLTKIILFLLLISALVYIGFKTFSMTQSLSANWQEVLFAFNKPALVKSMRVQYEKREAALDTEFTSGHNTDEKVVIKQMVQDEMAAQSHSTYPSFK